MRHAQLFLSAFAILAAACSSSNGALGPGSAAGGYGGTVFGYGGSTNTGASSGYVNGNGNGNGLGFCVLGGQGCPCDSGLCASNLACMSGTCCDATTGSCSPPPPSTGVPSGTGTGTAGSAAGGAMGMGMKPPPGKPGPGGAGSGGTTSTPSSGGACVPGVAGPVITDCGYPFASSNPLTSVAFNESEVLRAIVPSGGSPIASVRVFYNDEHALTLGVRSVLVGTSQTDYAVSPLPTDPASTRYPQTGTNLLSGDQSGLDQSARPMWPALFVTDITDDPNNRSGDWQQGGTPWNPNAIFGTWKAAIRTVSASGVDITPDADPAKNNWNLAAGDTVPTGLKNEGYGAEARWDLLLTPGRSYRIQVMVHDGDQNKVGGDSGEACVAFCADASCPEGSDPCVEGGTACTRERSCVSGCCL